MKKFKIKIIEEGSMDQKYNNIFFENILQPRETWFISKLIQDYRIKKYYKDLYNTSPSYAMMREMAEFIKIAELAYFYHNSNKIDCDGMPVTYTNNNIIYLEFMLTEHKICTIGLKQNSDTIILNIKNIVTNEIITSLKFKDRQLVIDNKIDEQLFINLLRSMMRSFIKLMKYCRNIQWDE